MLGSTILEVAIGMIFVFLLLSLIASVVQELLASFMQLRAANLLKGVRSLFSGDTFEGQDLVDSIYTHGLVRGLFSDPGKDKGATSKPGKDADGRPLDGLRYFLRKLIGIEPGKTVEGVSNQLLLPNYIPSRTFALALIDLLTRGKQAGVDTLTSITNSLATEIRNNPKNKAAEALYTLAKDAAADAATAQEKLVTFQKNVEDWYNDGMDRVSGWYKRYTQRVLLVIGFLIALGFNVSTARVAQTLWFDKDTRDAMAKAANEYVREHPNPPVTNSSVNNQNGNQPTNGGGSGDGTPGNATAIAPGTRNITSTGSTTTNGANTSTGTRNTSNAASTSGESAPGGSDALPSSPPANSTPTMVETTQSSGADAKSEANKASKPGDLVKKLEESANAFNDVTSQSLLPVGWKHSWGFYWDMFRANKLSGTWRALKLLFGWFITACAISLGAPFWFDMLNKIMVVRSTIKPQEKSQPEKSKS